MVNFPSTGGAAQSSSSRSNSSTNSTRSSESSTIKSFKTIILQFYESVRIPRDTTVPNEKNKQLFRLFILDLVKKQILPNDKATITQIFQRVLPVLSRTIPQATESLSLFLNDKDLMNSLEKILADPNFKISNEIIQYNQFSQAPYGSRSNEKAFFFKDGSHYQGGISQTQTETIKLEGDGILTFPDGTRFTGNFYNGKANKQCLYIFRDKSSLKVTYKDGKPDLSSISTQKNTTKQSKAKERPQNSEASIFASYLSSKPTFEIPPFNF